MLPLNFGGRLAPSRFQRDVHVTPAGAIGGVEPRLPEQPRPREGIGLREHSARTSRRVSALNVHGAARCCAWEVPARVEVEGGQLAEPSQGQVEATLVPAYKWRFATRSIRRF